MEQKRICVNKFSVEPPSQYSYSEMGSKIFHRCFEVDDVGIRPRQTHPGLPEGKNFYTHTPARALRWEGRPVRPWREAHSLSPCPDGQRLRYGPGSRTLSPACSTPRALLSMAPAKYRLPPMPPPPCSAQSPSPHREDWGRADHLFFLYPKACGSRTAFGVRQDPFWAWDSSCQRKKDPPPWTSPFRPPPTVGS
jgi:hypothetical protein